MRIIDVISMCFRNLFKRKLRTFLTLLGVMIGTGSIIVMISLGLATDAQFARMIEEMNLDMTAIHVTRRWGGTQWHPDGTMTQQEQGGELTDESADRFERIPGVVVSTPMMQGQILLRTGPYALNSWDVRGIRPEALSLMGYEVEYGRLLEPGDEFAAVFASRAELDFFTTIIPAGQTWFSFGGDRYWRAREGEEVPTYVDIFNDPLRIYYDMNVLWRSIRWGDDDDGGGVAIDEAFAPVRSFPFEVVGLLEHYETDRWDSPRSNRAIYMNIETLQTLNLLRIQADRREQQDNDWWPRVDMSVGGVRETYDLIFVRADTMDDTSRIASAIEAMGYNAQFQGEQIERQREQQRGIQTLLAAIAAVSLLVAAINIANTMITSVTERTREIGIMKVIGASLADIRKLFLLEAVVIGVLGGVFGVAIALGTSYAMNNFDIAFLSDLNIVAEGAEAAAISLITPWLCALALAVAGGVGLLSGFFPAFRATRLSALAAIRGD
ncbi:MAG: ABC transporter permease [Defluviitaleaceae bacterium]|nr:ABC transporter permease [Defluviitaleaceae bacterium]